MCNSWKYLQIHHPMPVVWRAHTEYLQPEGSRWNQLPLGFLLQLNCRAFLGVLEHSLGSQLRINGDTMLPWLSFPFKWKTCHHSHCAGLWNMGLSREIHRIQAFCFLWHEAVSLLMKVQCVEWKYSQQTLRHTSHHSEWLQALCLWCLSNHTAALT